jgi:ABC-type sulfate transport system permease subunit
MAGGTYVGQLEDRASRPGRDGIMSAAARCFFIGASLFFLAALLFAPLTAVIAMAFEHGVAAYFVSFIDPERAPFDSRSPWRQ